jgi:hypothetical protein
MAAATLLPFGPALGAMRILLVFDGPLDDSAVAQQVVSLGTALIGAGHGVRLVTVEPGSAPSVFAIRSVHTRPLSPLPNDVELGEYREAFRQALDEEVAAWNPDLIHVQQASILAQLALESGAPYLITARGPEFKMAAQDERLLALAQQGAENAGRILAADASTKARLSRLAEGIDERIEVLPAGEITAERILAIYRAVLEQRFGAQSA